MPEYFHLAVAWDWEYDREFVVLLEEQIHQHHLRCYSISHHNLHETLKKTQKGEVVFGAFLDRASDGDEKFIPLARLIQKTVQITINSHDAIHRAADKATMHLEFLSAGIHVPFTIIISPYSKKNEVELTLSDLATLGRPFIIKPANTTGGGIGVILGAETLKDVIESRQHHKNDKYLLQEKIRRVRMGVRKAWFRVFHTFGLTIPCWWDDESHVYAPLTREDLHTYGLRPLYMTVRRIQQVCNLDFFSTEIAVTEEGRFVVVDYVNEICDMRLQSFHFDGVPDGVVREISRRIARHLQRALK